MERYIEVDKNMLAEASIGDAEVVWCDIKEKPFVIHGSYDEAGVDFYHRMPMDVAARTSDGVKTLARESSGIRVRFSTDSPYIALRVKYVTFARSSHISLVANAGFDMYVETEFGPRFVKEFRMAPDMTGGYEQLVKLEGSYMRTYTINFPIHAVVSSVEIGLKPNARLGDPVPYRSYAPVVFYGSSIVHGTAASRPGNIYPAIISRMLNVDFLDLGFSGKALGEEAIAEWIRDLDMSVFVCDYDHNAPTVEHLSKTHYRFYEIIREKNPDLPYIMISTTDYWTRHTEWENVLRRRDIIMESYLKARANGDKNVYFIDGMSFNAVPHQYERTVDGVHPNDAGFIRMAEGIGTFIRHILEKQSNC